MIGLWRQEWHLFVKARANVGLLAVLLVLSALGAWNGIERLAAERSAAVAALADDVSSFAAKREKLVQLEAGKIVEGRFGSPRKPQQAVLSAGRPVTPPPAELGVLSSAEARPTPELLRISILTRHKDQQPTLDDPSNRLDGPFDLAFVATWLGPLFALILGYDVLARDREQGVAALLASQGRSLAAIAFARLGVRFAALMIVIGGVAFGAAIVTESGRLAVALPAFAVWLLALGLSLGFWLALTAVINGRAKNAAAASLAVLGVWIGLSMFMPALIGSVVNTLAPPPDRLQGVLKLRSVESDLNRRRREVTAAYYSAYPANRPIVQGDEYEHYFVTELYPRTLAFDRAVTPFAAQMDAARVRQAELMRAASFLSPSLAFKLLTEDLAGAAPERRVAFLTSVDDYQARWRGHFDHKLASMTWLTVADYDHKPEFKRAAERAAARWARISLLMAALCAPLLIALAGAWRALSRAAPT